MITNVTSKVDLPAAANRTSRTDAPSKNEQGTEKARGSEAVLTSSTQRASVEQAVGKVREFLRQSDSHLQIEVDPDLQRVIVKILNGDTGEVIRQIPPKEVIELAKNLSHQKGLLFEERV